MGLFSKIKFKPFKPNVSADTAKTSVDLLLVVLGLVSLLPGGIGQVARASRAAFEALDASIDPASDGGTLLTIDEAKAVGLAFIGAL